MRVGMTYFLRTMASFDETLTDADITNERVNQTSDDYDSYMQHQFIYQLV